MSLQRQRYIAHLIEEQRAAVSLLQQAQHALFRRSSEITRGIAEQLAFNQILGNGGAVHHHKRLVPSLARGVQLQGEVLFPRIRVGLCWRHHLTYCAIKKLELVELVKRTGLKPIPAVRRPMAEVNSAIDDLHHGKVIGRTILVP